MNFPSSILFIEWKDNVESKGMNKTKVMISGERQQVRQKAVRWPCGVCSKGVGSNTIQCTFGAVRGHSRSSAMSPFDRAHTTSYSTLIETMRLSCTVFEI